MEIRPTYLLMITAENNNKYYNCFPEGDTFRVEYGRVDATKTTAHYPMSKWNSQINSKLKKGYKDVTDLKQELVRAVDKSGKEYKEIENESIRLIVEKLQSMANDTIKKHYSVAASAVTQTMVDEAQKIIDKLASNTYTVDKFNKSLLELYTVIPRRMNHVDKYLASDPNEFGKVINREQDLLDVMRGQVFIPVANNVNATDEASDHTILDEYGLTFEDVSKEEEQLIRTLMNESESRYSRAWRVNNINTQKKYDDYLRKNNIKNTKLLFHGSRNENFWSIIKTGLVLRPTNAIITGKMFGYGIYYSPKCRKSIGYTSISGSYWAGGHDRVAYMAIFEVAYGTPYDVYSHESKYYALDYDKLQKLKSGANCLHAHASKGMLQNDEIVVYREDQMTIKYLIEIK